MRGIKIPVQDFARKMQGGLIHEGGVFAEILFSTMSPSSMVVFGSLKWRQIFRFSHSELALHLRSHYESLSHCPLPPLHSLLDFILHL